MVERHAGCVEVLVVYTVYQHEMAEYIFGNGISPRHLLTCRKGIAHLVEVEVGSIVGKVAIRHVCIEELHGLALGTVEGVEAQGESPEVEVGTACGKVGFNLLAVFFVCNEMGVAVAGREKQEQGKNGNKGSTDAK